jgi:antitoxin (DNA-binding transcriptional repressor) of toxin-antitoxin stability system
MKTVTMLEFLRNAEALLKRVAKGERFLLSHRGQPAARLEPINAPPLVDTPDDPFLNIGQRAQASPKGNTQHRDIDHLLYGRT